MRKWKVYLSSTYKDLAGKRAELINYFEKQLKESFELTIIMERMYDDGSHTAFELDCEKQVQLCDIYILIQGNSIGSYVPKTTTTYTERELDTAIQLGKKIYILQLDPYDEKEIEKKNKPKHKELLEKFKGKPTHYFYDLDAIKLKFLECLTPFVNTKPTDKTNPYKGLAAFEVTDGAYFFGRTSEKKDFFKKIIPSNQSNRLIAVIGNSGIGKSSFIKAGILYDLAQQDQYGYTDYKQLIIAPGSNSFTNLMYELEIGGITYTTNDLGIVFDQKVLLFFNQFEEVITQSTTTEALKERNKLFDFLNKIQTQNVLIIITFRSDYLSALCNFEFIKSPPQIYFPLSSLDYSVSYSNWKQSIEEIIIAPAALNGITFESELVTKLINEIKEVDGSLPILQFTLQQLWTPETIADGTITVAEYEKISGAKGIAGIIEQHAENVFHTLTYNSPTTENLFRLLFINLVEVTDSKTDVRKTISKDQLINKLQAFDSKEVTRVFEYLVSDKSRLITIYESSGVHCVDIIHEVLIRKWERLKQWINERRSSLEKEKEFELWATKYLRSLNSKFLLNNNQLEEITNFQKENTDLILNDNVLLLIDQSTIQLKKRKRRNNFLKIGVGFSIVLFVSLLYIYEKERNEKQFNYLFQSNRNLRNYYIESKGNFDSIQELIIFDSTAYNLLKNNYYRFKNLKKIELDLDSTLINFNDFDKNLKIESLKLNYNEMWDFNFDGIDKLSNLDSLTIHGFFREIKNLSDKRLTNVKQLSILNTNIEDLRFLKSSKFNNIVIRYNDNLKSLKGLENLYQLEEISVVSNKSIQDMPSLCNLTKLKKIIFLNNENRIFLNYIQYYSEDINNAKIENENQNFQLNLSFLPNKIRFLSVSYFHLKNLEKITLLKSLDTLKLYGNYNNKELKKITNFNRLKSFTLKYNQIIEFDDLPNSKILKSLELTNLKVKSISSIDAKFINLTTLILKNNQYLDSIQGIEKLRNLEELEITNEYSKEYANYFYKFKNLKKLTVSNNIKFDSLIVKNNNPGIKIIIVN